MHPKNLSAYDGSFWGLFKMYSTSLMFLKNRWKKLQAIDPIEICQIQVSIFNLKKERFQKVWFRKKVIANFLIKNYTRYKRIKASA